MRNKNLLRDIKRTIKKDGNRSRRRHFKRELDKDPTNAHWVEFDFNDFNSSTIYNGFDEDRTRSCRN